MEDIFVCLWHIDERSSYPAKRQHTDEHIDELIGRDIFSYHNVTIVKFVCRKSVLRLAASPANIQLARMLRIVFSSVFVSFTVVLSYSKVRW